MRFEIGNAQNLPYPGGQFNASLSLLAFNFVPDPHGALAELKRVTRRHGPICAAVWDYGGRMDMLRVFWDAAIALDPGAEESDEKHIPLCRAGELSQLWKQAGLAHVEDQALEIMMIFKSFDDYWEPFMAGQGPAGDYVARLSPDPLSNSVAFDTQVSSTPLARCAYLGPYDAGNARFKIFAD